MLSSKSICTKKKIIISDYDNMIKIIKFYFIRLLKYIWIYNSFFNWLEVEKFQWEIFDKFLRQVNSCPKFVLLVLFANRNNLSVKLKNSKLNN